MRRMETLTLLGLCAAFFLIGIGRLLHGIFRGALPTPLVLNAPAIDDGRSAPPSRL